MRAQNVSELPPSRRGRPQNFALDPHRVKPDLARFAITLLMIAERARLGGAKAGRICYVSNVLSGRQNSPRVLLAARALIADYQRGNVP